MPSANRRLFFGLVAVLLALCGPVAAAPFDDALAAYNKGEFSKAAHLFQQLANAGDPQAEHNLGFLYHAGKGVAKNDATAMKWYRKAADQGFAASQFNLGVMYQEGQGVSADMDQAVAWYTKAANQNYLAAENKLFQYYFAKQDTADAIVWLRKAAEQGDAGAQFNLGSFYFNGWGAPKDNQQARVWYAKAAAQNFPVAADVLKKLDAVK